jgi:hypothetical protein
MGEPPPGTPLTLRLLAKIGRGLLLSSYVRAYERHTVERIDDARLRRWEIVNLAARILDEVPVSGSGVIVMTGGRNYRRRE